MEFEPSPTLLDATSASASTQLLAWKSMDDYDRFIEEAKQRLNLPGDKPAFDLGGDEVQLSVRIPSGLRDALNGAARRRGVILTALVTELFVNAVGSDRDPFVALASDLADRIRTELAAAVAAGDYAAAAAAINKAEADLATR